MNWFWRRRHVLVDPAFQLQYLKMGLLTAAAIAVPAMFLVVVLVARPIADSDAQRMLVSLAVGMALFVVLYAFLIGLLNVVMTHRVAGAARKLHGRLLDLIEGRWDGEVTLRKSDYLQNLASGLNDLACALRHKRADVGECVARLEALRDRCPEDLRRDLEDVLDRLRRHAPAPAPA
jgi:hypothetical protein